MRDYRVKALINVGGMALNVGWGWVTFTVEARSPVDAAAKAVRAMVNNGIEHDHVSATAKRTTGGHGG